MSRKSQTKEGAPNIPDHVRPPVYLDCNATTPLEPAVREVVLRFLTEEFGNEGSRTHEYGARARQAVLQARDQIAKVVGCRREEVIFTSGATESNNLAILGLAAFGETAGRRHIISTRIEHKAVLEPLEELASRGFEVELLPSSVGGRIEAEAISAALRPETLLVSVMHANNETGVIQPVDEIASALQGHPAFFHVDAAQTFGKVFEPLRNSRIDLIGISGHKIYGPKGIGALIVRRRGFDRLPLKPICFGGGQERGLRPGTLPVPLIVGFGVAADSAVKHHAVRAERCSSFRRRLLDVLEPLNPRLHGDQHHVLPHVVNFSIAGINSEAAMVAMKDLVAVSNGSACTSSSYQPSHVLKAMGLPEDEVLGSLRFSWCHLTPEADWPGVVERLASLR